MSAAWPHSLGLPEYWNFLSSLQGAAKLRIGNQPKKRATGMFQDQTSVHLHKSISLFGLSPASSPRHQETWKTQRTLILSFSCALIKL